jgi:hypothetical protein
MLACKHEVLARRGKVGRGRRIDNSSNEERGGL